jgi:hypothetical protein
MSFGTGVGRATVTCTVRGVGRALFADAHHAYFNTILGYVWGIGIPVTAMIVEDWPRNVVSVVAFAAVTFWLNSLGPVQSRLLQFKRWQEGR